MTTATSIKPAAFTSLAKTKNVIRTRTRKRRKSPYADANEKALSVDVTNVTNLA